MTKRFEESGTRLNTIRLMLGALSVPIRVGSKDKFVAFNPAFCAIGPETRAGLLVDVLVAPWIGLRGMLSHLLAVKDTQRKARENVREQRIGC